jgi:serine/threonine-protein kinase
METSLTDELIGRRLGNFVVERLLGVGGMAHVYQAHDALLGREVAIKALSPAFLADPGYVERFRSEAHHVAALEHQNIVPILAFIEQDRGLYVVMPLYAKSLQDVLDRRTRLPLNEAMTIVVEIGSALAMAHSHGLVHRDVKPGNILLDANGTAALADFGIARQASFKGNPDALTLSGTGLPVGTPEYMPPEQLRGTNVDQRSDIYALSVVLYEMLTGRTPHTGNSPFEVAAAALTEPVMRPSQLNPVITAPVEAVILRALSMRAEDRYANVKSFVEDLQKAAQKPASSAMGVAPRVAWPSRHGHAQRVGAPGQRRGAWWMTAALIALAVIIVFGGGVALLADLTAHPAARGPLPSSDQTSNSSQASATVTVVNGATAIPVVTPTGTTTPAPSATLSPPPLSLGALRLKRGHGGECSGSQIIRNSGVQRITWQWSSVQPSAPQVLVYGVNTSPHSGGLPADLNPGVAPGGTDTLNMEMKCTGQSYAVTLRDGLGRAQQFTMTSD